LTDPGGETQRGDPITLAASRLDLSHFVGEVSLAGYEW